MYERDIKHQLKMLCECKSKFCENSSIENSEYRTECRQRTLMPKPHKHLPNPHRKCFSRRRMSSILCQIVLAFQLIIFFFGPNTLIEIDALEDYNRLSISDISSIDIDAIRSQSGHYSSDYRHVTHEELLSIGDGFDNFTDPGVTHFSEILFDFDHYQIIVGARDTLYRLDLKGLNKLEKATWQASPDDMGMCQVKGQTEDDCHNFVKVLVSHRDRIFACGTHAFNPKCSWRNIQEIGRIIKAVDGRAKCPYSPHSNVTAMMTGVNGDYYISTPIDFSSNDPAIYRMAAGATKGFGSEPVLRTSQFNSMWLSGPDFVFSFETRKFMYFLFRETATEAMNCGKAVYSRIARVCKNDQGYDYLKNKRENKWTTFLKARLNCSVPGDYPFYFDEIQSAFYVNDAENEDNGLVYAVFTTPENSIAGSAICSFNLTSIESTFKGPFKTQENQDPTKTWVSDNSIPTGERRRFECERPQLAPSGVDAVDSRKYQLMDEAVDSTTFGPLYHETSVRYTHIVVDAVHTKYDPSFGSQSDSYSSTSSIHALFVTIRDYGLIKKISYNTVTQQSCIVEIIHPFPNTMTSHASSPTVYTMKFKSGLGTETQSLYLGTEDGLLRVPTSRCMRFKSQNQCLSSGDPYCGWNTRSQSCTVAPNHNPGATWEQSSSGFSCPDTNIQIHSGWGKWSDWSLCTQSESTTSSTLGYYGLPESSISGKSSQDKSLSCLCRRRTCNNIFENQPCSRIDGGHSIEVTNCTQDGQWTSWSEWGPCSKTCDVGRRYRKRSCGNPAPAFGGRVCVGRDRDSAICNDLPPCNANKKEDISALSTASLTRYQGNDRNQWSQWSEWSQCSTNNQCGKGFRSRKRLCNRSVGLSVTTCDESCATQFEECFSPNGNCSAYVDVSDYTPWVQVRKEGSRSSLNLGRGWNEKRFLFVYHGTAINAAQNPKLGDRIVTEERYCVSEGKCSSITPRSTKRGWNKNVLDRWSNWSSCTRECGGGKQVKVLSCSRTENDRSCQGRQDGFITVVERACNTHPCQSQWTCWSDWSDCGSNGMAYRQRRCKDIQANILSSKIKDCGEGQSYEEKSCSSLMEESDEKTVTMKASTAEATMSMVVGASIICLILGILIGAGIMFYMIRFRCKGILHGAGGGGPHYVSAKSQNLYVSLPMLDLTNTSTITSTSTLGRPKGKAFGGCVTNNGSDQSDFGTIRSTSTIRSKAGSSIYDRGLHKGSVVGSDYDTATIKRSRSHRNSSLINGAVAMRADLDSDNIFT